MKREQTIQLAENLKRLLASRKLTVTTAARQIGMNKSTLHNYCNGIVPRHLLKIKELADLLGVPLSELILSPLDEQKMKPSGNGIEGHFEIIVRRKEGS